MTGHRSSVGDREDGSVGDGDRAMTDSNETNHEATDGPQPGVHSGDSIKTIVTL